MLILDDDAAIRLVCRLNLELEGFSVLEAESLADARAALDSGTIHVVLLDVRIGRDDGLAFLREVKRDRPHVGVALLTGSADRDELRESGADAILSKPFELDELTGTVGRLAANAR